MDDGPAVSAAVPVHHIPESRKGRLTADPASGPDTTEHLADYARQRKGDQAKGKQRVDLPEAEEHAACCCDDSRHDGQDEIALQRSRGGAPPSQEGPYADHEQQQQPDGDGGAVEVGRPHGDLYAPYRFGQDGEHGAPQHGQGQSYEDHVVKQKSALAADE